MGLIKYSWLEWHRIILSVITYKEQKSIAVQNLLQAFEKLSEYQKVCKTIDKDSLELAIC